MSGAANADAGKNAAAKRMFRNCAPSPRRAVRRSAQLMFGNGFGFGAPRSLCTLRAVISMLREYCTSISIVALLLCSQAIGVANETATSERHVVVVVWDGMRPDFVSEENTPTLWKLANEGVVFRNHHAVYPSATNVNGTALVTGVYPGRSGLIANHDYLPAIDSRKSLDVEIPKVVEKGDELSGGKYISIPTIAEMVQRAGGRTAIATAKTVGLLLDRQVDPGHAKNCVTLFAGQSRPRQALNPIVRALGPFPPFGQITEGDKWTTKAFTDFLWKDGVPAFSLLWLGDPDLTQHQTAPGAQPALAAIKSCDENLAGVIFTKKAMEGTFGLKHAKIESDHAPDVVMAFRCNEKKNQFGVPGMIDADWQRAAGKGTHATLSRFDMHNTLIAAGPDFRRGEADDLPTGNIDVTPTILQILGIKAPVQMDGRILSEAMTKIDVPALKPETKTVEATKDFPSAGWRQSLQISRVGSTIYFDEGNGAFEKK